MAGEVGEFLVRDGLTLRTRHWETDEPRARVILVHGVAEHSGRWEHVGEFLAERGYDVRGYDWRGHGESEGPRGHVETFDHLVDDLQEILESLPDDLPIFIYGHSAGGLISATYAVSDRPQPAGFVLSAPALAAEIPAALRTAAKLLPKVAPMLRLKTPVKGAHLSRDPDVAEAYFADPLMQFPTTTWFGSEVLRTMEATRGKLHEIDVPVLVVHGAEDELVPPSASAPLAGVPTAQRRLYAGLRHEIHNEPEQDQVLGEIADWLDEQTAAIR